MLIADDHPAVREGLRAILRHQSDMATVATAGTGREAVALWEELHPDIGLLDIRMPELDGVDALAEILTHDPAARVILLTAFYNDEYVYQGMRTGAKAFLPKEADSQEILRCIRRVHAGEVWIPADIAAKLARRVSGPELTDRELEVLRWLAQGKSNKEIGAVLHISETTVKSHVKGIFGKLRVLSRTEAIMAAGRRGLIRF